MDFKDIVFSFLVGGTVTALIVGLEQSNMQLWSGIAAIMPVFTLVSYIFIGSSGNSIAVSRHAKFVLFGTIVAWVPYMIVIAWTTPKLGTNRSLLLGLLTFIVMGFAYVGAVEKLRLFK
jgi:uncharacterized membrane protein (GlpM family)